MVTTASIMCILFGSTGISLDVCFFGYSRSKSVCFLSYKLSPKKRWAVYRLFLHITAVGMFVVGGGGGGGGEGGTALSTLCYWRWTKVDVCVAVTLVCSLLSPDHNNLVAQMSVIISMRVNLCWDQCRQWLAHLVCIENNIRCQRLAL